MLIFQILFLWNFSRLWKNIIRNSHYIDQPRNSVGGHSGVRIPGGGVVLEPVCHSLLSHLWIREVTVKLGLLIFWHHHSEVAQSCRLFATLWTVAYQAPPYMGFSRQEFWSRVPFPSPGDLLDPGIEPRSPTLQTRCITIWASREASFDIYYKYFPNFSFVF